ncbi:MAG TPA: Gfo/Idh/MocA family oxidoreductase [Streptosporangiaceae bacterium]
MRIGLLGLGRIGAFHAETLAGLPAVEELVLSDPVPELAEQVAGRFGGRIAGSPAAVLSSGIDGVVIAAPTRLHAELIELCVAAGLLRRPGPTSPPRAGSSVTAPCTTTTPSGG